MKGKSKQGGIVSVEHITQSILVFRGHKHDQQITAILSAIRELVNPPVPKRRGIGFTADLDK